MSEESIDDECVTSHCRHARRRGASSGINSVISAVTIRCIIGGSEVLGFLNGFKWLMEGNTAHVHPVSIEDVSRIHFRGGSHSGTSRANPLKSRSIWIASCPP